MLQKQSKPLKIEKKCKNCQIAKMQKFAQKIAISLKNAKNRGRDFPEGQMHTKCHIVFTSYDIN